MLQMSQDELTPKNISKLLDKFVIGQEKAKKVVANALRNRWRRMKTPLDIQSEIKPKHILMMGPTGVGKTEIARRIAKITSSPFIKVDATEYTAVGYMGKDVQSIIKDLLEIAIDKVKAETKEALREEARRTAEEQVLKLLGATDNPATRQEMLEKLKKGELDSRTVEISISQPVEIHGNQIPDFPQKMVIKKKTKVTPTEALSFFEMEKINREIEGDQVAAKAIKQVEESGIVFIDEIDKICESRERYHKDSVNRGEVQRDMLTMLDGKDVTTKHGLVKTDHILFIACGAFHSAKKEDMMSEMQGRFPVTVKMHSLSKSDFIQILSEKEVNLIKQRTELLKQDSIELEFTKDGIEQIADIAILLNLNEEDTGARRLDGIIENLTQDVGFDVEKYSGQKVVIDKKFVESQNIMPTINESDSIL